MNSKESSSSYYTLRDEAFWEGKSQTRTFPVHIHTNQNTTTRTGYYESNHEEKGFDWLFSFEDIDLKTWREMYLGRDVDAKILVVGSGHSEMPIHMYDAGWKDITAVDSSGTVITRMKKDFPDKVKWVQSDVRDMRCFEDKTFDVILDKACVDALLCFKKKNDVVEKYVQEARRVLKSDGQFVIFTSKRVENGGVTGDAMVLPHMKRNFSSVKSTVIKNPRDEVKGICPMYSWWHPSDYICIQAAP